MHARRYMVMCLEQSIDEDVDVVLVEYILNDGFENQVLGNGLLAVYERLMRRILKKRNNPAVILVQVRGRCAGVWVYVCLYGCGCVWMCVTVLCMWL